MPDPRRRLCSGAVSDRKFSARTMDVLSTIDSDRWPRVEGVIIRGHGVASGRGAESPYPRGTVEMQKPFFAALGFDLTGLHEATLNVDLSPWRFRLRHPAHTFHRVEWTHLHPPETFSFSRCRIGHGGREVDAWIYTPHPGTKADHFQPPAMLEILAPFLPGVGYGDAVTLRIAPEEVELMAP